MCDILSSLLNRKLEKNLSEVLCGKRREQHQYKNYFIVATEV